tara:strand:+ start:6179 stop:6391 length:213 start_codon:yes stop_codon:yes gene_type:complete
MSEEQLAELTERDRAKFTHFGATRNLGRKSNPVVLVIREALDEYLERYHNDVSNLPLFANLETNDDGDDG